MPIEQPAATARKVPSVRELKDEVEAKRNLAKSNGKTLKNNVAMKEVARKYGCRTWEELHALALGSTLAPAAAPSAVSVILLRINKFAKVLILNRSIIATHNANDDARPVDGLAEDIAQALGVKLEFVNHDAEDIPQWAFAGVAEKLGLIGDAAKPDSDSIEPQGKTPAEQLANFYGTENSWGEHPNYPRADWRYEVEHDNTGRSYWEYVASEIESNDDVYPWEPELVMAQKVLDELGWDVRKSGATNSDSGWCVHVGNVQTPLYENENTAEDATLVAYRDIVSQASGWRKISVEKFKQLPFRRQEEIITDYLCDPDKRS
jgi:hypothetical protein